MSTLVELAAAIERVPLTTLPSSPEVRLALEARLRAWNVLRHTLGVIEHAQRAHTKDFLLSRPGPRASSPGAPAPHLKGATT